MYINIIKVFINCPEYNFYMVVTIKNKLQYMLKKIGHI